MAQTSSTENSADAAITTRRVSVQTNTTRMVIMRRQAAAISRVSEKPVTVMMMVGSTKPSPMLFARPPSARSSR